MLPVKGHPDDAQLSPRIAPNSTLAAAIDAAIAAAAAGDEGGASANASSHQSALSPRSTAADDVALAVFAGRPPLHTTTHPMLRTTRLPRRAARGSEAEAVPASSSSNKPAADSTLPPAAAVAAAAAETAAAAAAVPEIEVDRGASCAGDRAALVPRGASLDNSDASAHGYSGHSGHSGGAADAERAAVEEAEITRLVEEEEARARRHRVQLMRVEDLEADGQSLL